MKDHWQKTLLRTTGSGDDDDNGGDDDDGVYEIGETGPAGGLVFYVDEADEFEWTYMEAWVDDMDDDYGAWHTDQNSHTSGTSTNVNKIMFLSVLPKKRV